MTTFSKVTTVDTTNLQPGDLIHMEVAFFNVTFIHGFTSMLTGVFAKNIIIWLFHTASKLAPVRIILFILTTLNNKQHPCKCVRVDEDGTLKSQQMSLNLLLMTSSSPWKLLMVIQTNTTQVITEQLHLGLESPFFTDITMFTYIKPEKCNVQILNGRNPLQNFLVL